MTTPHFESWMRRNFGAGYFWACMPCRSWRINGTTVTLWHRTALVKIYHNNGWSTLWYRAETEQCRKAVLALPTNRHTTVRSPSI